MSRLIGALLCACLLACGLGQAAHAAPLQFAYKGAGCDGRKAMPAFEAVLGRKADGAADFVNYFADWPGAVSASKWGSGCWKGSGYRLSWAVPLAVYKGANADLASTAAGKNNAYFAAIATQLVADGHGDAFIRPGWEFNGGWEPWGGKTPAVVAEAYRQAHDVMLVPGQHFQFVWNPALYEQGFWPDQAYPGDAYVDVIAVDAYGTSWGSTDPATISAHAVSDGTQWNVAHVVAFAKAHGKPYAFPEWGTGHNGSDASNPGTGDYPPFVKAMTPYVQGALYATYWDFPASDYDASFAHNPQAAAAFKAAFGPQPLVVVQAAPPMITATIDHGGTVVVAPNADGSATLNLGFPLAPLPITYTITFAEPRRVGFGNGKGGLRGGLWNGGRPYKAFTWGVSASTSPKPQVYAAPK